MLARFVLVPALALGALAGIGLHALITGRAPHGAISSASAIGLAREAAAVGGEDVQLVSARHGKVSDFDTGSPDGEAPVWAVIFKGGNYPAPSCGPPRPNPVCPPPAHSVMVVLDDEDGTTLFVEYPAPELNH